MKKYFFAPIALFIGMIFFCYSANTVFAELTKEPPIQSEEYNRFVDVLIGAVENTPGYTPEYKREYKKEGESLKGEIAKTIAEYTPTEVIVTEKIPGMDCEEITTGGPALKKYKCTVKSGFGSVMLIFKGLIKYTTFLVALIGVLMLVVSGIQYSISGADESQAKNAKERIKKVLMGIVLLFLIGFILNSVAPWIYR